MSRTLGMAVFLFFAVPAISFAAAGERTFSGMVTKINGNQITIKTASAASYTAETSMAALVRKNGAGMRFEEILVGDKLEVRGRLWPDNSMNAFYVRNMSLYTHNSTFSGKIASIDTSGAGFTLQSKQHGLQNIHTDSYTVFKKNGKSATFRDLQMGISAKVKALWDRSPADVAAKSVEATVRLVNIEITGTLSMKNGTGFTVTANNTIYGVDAEKAKFLGKNGKPLGLERFSLGDTIKVSGKHISESVQIYATTVKNMSVSK